MSTCPECGGTGYVAHTFSLDNPCSRGCKPPALLRQCQQCGEEKCHENHYLEHPFDPPKKDGTMSNEAPERIWTFDDGITPTYTSEGPLQPNIFPEAVEYVRADLTPPEQTHWEGCWRDPKHHGCAVAKVERLELELATIKKSPRGSIYAALLEAKRLDRQRIKAVLRALKESGAAAYGTVGDYATAIDDAIKAVDDE
jgi:hypothetical protein